MPVWLLMAFMVGTDVRDGLDSAPPVPASGFASSCSNGITHAGVGVAQTRALLGISVSLDVEADTVFSLRAPPSRLLPALKLGALPPLPQVPRLGLRVREGGVALRLGALSISISLRLDVGALFTLLQSAVSVAQLRCVPSPSVALMPWKTALNVAMADPNLPDLRVDLMASLNLMVRLRNSGASVDPGSMVTASYNPWAAGDGWGSRYGGNYQPQTRNVFTPVWGVSRPSSGYLGPRLAPPQFSAPPVVQPRQDGAPSAFQPSFTGGM